MPPFSPDEVRRRWAAVQHRMDEALDALVVVSFHGSYYLTGMPVMPLGRWAVTVLPRSGAPAVVAPRIDAEALARDTPVPRVLGYDDTRPTIAAVAGLVAETLRGTRVVGIEGMAMPVALRDALAALLPGVRFVDATAAFDGARLVSSGAELELVVRAGAIAMAGMDAARAALDAGGSEASVTARLREVMTRLLPDDAPGELLVIVQAGGRSATEAHRPSTSAPLGDGLVQVLCECGIWHYRAAVARCLPLGRVSDAEARALEIADAAFAAALAAVRPGARCCDVDAAARALLRDHGEVPTGAGFAYPLVHEHGGRSELAELRPYNERPLEPGMILMLEPWAMVPGVGGPRRADMVRVGARSAVPLTR